MSKKYQNAVPDELKQIFEEMQNSDGTFTVDSEIKLLETRIYQLYMQEYPITKVWKELRTNWKDYKVAQKKGDVIKAQVALSTIDDIMDNKYITYQKWDEIMRLSEQRRRLIETNTKTELAKQEMISMQVLSELVANYGKRVTDIIKQFVPDKALQAQIADAIIEVEIEG